MKRPLIAFLLAALFGGLLVGPASAAVADRLAALPAASTPDWAAPGPYPVTEEALDAAHTVYRPTTLGQNGMLHPIIIWGNGTNAVPLFYRDLLRHWASWGFVVAAANTTNSGSGKEMLDGATVLQRLNQTPSSIYYGRLDTSKIGASGHSQGGGGTIAAGADPRITTTVPIEPGPQGGISALHGPMFILGGQWDTIVIPSILVIPRYNQATRIPAIYGELARATHFTPVGNGGGFRGPITAWFRFWLMGDQQARAEFFGPDTACRQCQSPAWSSFRRNALAQQVPGA